MLAFSPAARALLARAPIKARQTATQSQKKHANVYMAENTLQRNQERNMQKRANFVFMIILSDDFSFLSYKFVPIISLSIYW